MSKSTSEAANDAYQRTLSRLESIKSHLKTTPRSGRLQGKVCIITGVDSLKGIGRASALLFAHEGAKHLYLLDYSGKNLPELQRTIQKDYPDVQVTTVQADAANEEAISNLCDRAIKEEGRLDVFFANAGIVSVDHLDSLTEETFMRTMRVNALSVFLAIKYASIAMAKPNLSCGKSESGGSIILTASVAGIRSGAGPIDYSASKAAVNNMAQTAAYQLAKRNIRVNSICPGLIETGMTDFTFELARRRGTAAKIGQLNPLGRYGIAEEVAQATLFLASDESSYVNAQNIAVDGGLSGSIPVVPGKFH
ncbi:NAD-binding protein [Fomitiporia mediterranea MF3/22]|uniref:NAD-binding protein n=1 Tax=Fomitiporia mediterranea (strain MF3/22) TaxID=694068 RepID=UPI0004408A97|nr:NAD-binding protein [Fomitiporia mediterranea MF3/22]EJD03154.1 NAD-binding protein [Fomitiporia mediterranea MF3/22]